MAQIVTITNPITGQPAQVDQLDHTAQQIDDGLNIARGVSNPNLLDNWYFGNPVNQRNVSGAIDAVGYFLDRWKLVSGSVTIGSNGITLNGTIAQILETAVGTDVTASAMTTEGVVVASYDNNSKTISLTGTGQTFVAAKLELGSQQTLAHQDANGNWVLNEIPDYGEQLARCQRFYEKFLFCNGEGATPVGVRVQNAIGSDADLVTIGAYIYFATQKRTVPVVRIEYDIADGPTQTATVNWVDERCFSSTNIIVPAGQSIDIHWYEAIADL